MGTESSCSKARVQTVLARCSTCMFHVVCYQASEGVQVAKLIQQLRRVGTFALVPLATASVLWIVYMHIYVQHLQRAPCNIGWKYLKDRMKMAY